MNPGGDDYVGRNRAAWNATSATYQQRNDAFIAGGLKWGVWQISEDEVGGLGPVMGRDVLELGCGAAQWSIALAHLGARPVGLDVSERQLDAARAAAHCAGVELELVHASAEEVPFPDASFDVVFCDHGAIGYCDPYRTIPEAARLLRPGGRLAFCMHSPFVEACWPMDAPHPAERLLVPLFGLHQIPDDEDGMTSFNLPYGEWVRLLRRSAFVLEDLVELQPGADATSTYRDDTDRDWARRWPMEVVWVCTRES